MDELPQGVHVSSHDQAPSSQHHEELQRSVSGRLLFFYVLGDVLGSGIYALIGVMAFTVGGAFWLSFVVGVSIALLTGFAYAELITKYPQAAGAALYTHKAFNNAPLTFLVTFCLLAATVAAAGTLARVFGGVYFAEFVDGVPVGLVAVAFIVVLSLLNFRGITESVWTNMIMTLIETTGLLIILAIGATVLAQGDANLSAPFELNDGNPALVVLSGVALAFFAMTGFENAANIAEETKEPSKVFPKALLGGMAIAGVLYMVIAFIAAMVAPLDKLTEGNGEGGSLLTVVEAGPLAVPTLVFSAIALVAVTNTTLVSLAQSRIMYGMAKQGVIPRIFARTHSVRHTPWVAIVFTASVVCALLLLADVDRLATVTVLFLIVVYAMVCLAAIKLRSARVEHDHYRAPLAILVMGVLANAGILIHTVVDDPSSVLWCAAILAVGVVMYFLNGRVIRSTRSHTHSPQQSFDEAELEA
jgi:APA family basic amino acid/polyamine antiporter